MILLFCYLSPSAPPPGNCRVFSLLRAKWVDTDRSQLETRTEPVKEPKDISIGQLVVCFLRFMWFYFVDRLPLWSIATMVQWNNYPKNRRHLLRLTLNWPFTRKKPGSILPFFKTKKKKHFDTQWPHPIIWKEDAPGASSSASHRQRCPAIGGRWASCLSVTWLRPWAVVGRCRLEPVGRTTSIRGDPSPWVSWLRLSWYPPTFLSARFFHIFSIKIKTHTRNQRPGRSSKSKLLILRQHQILNFLAFGFFCWNLFYKLITSFFLGGGFFQYFLVNLFFLYCSFPRGFFLF